MLKQMQRISDDEACSDRSRGHVAMQLHRDASATHQHDIVFIGIKLDATARLKNI